ncbi:MAG: class I SAM-dependent methyltransferase [Treponema sp.]|nr:class I SAM-dependent methyltransferase [Treponema sp.]
MEDKIQYQATLFSNRISKNYKSLKKWARKNKITCYRLYDRDIPEIPLALDLYTFLPEEFFTKFQSNRLLEKINDAVSSNIPEAQVYIQDELERSYLHMYLYERPYEKDDHEEDVWLKVMADSAATTIGIKSSNVIIKTRKRLSGSEEGRSEQYEKIQTDRHIEGTVQEQGQLFKVNLTDYIDTGLFLDHRPLRSIIRASCEKKSVLNLFCYTGSFTVYAAEGKARRIESVDMSKTYIEWAKKNLEMNEFNILDTNKYSFIRQDAVGFLNQKNAEVANKEGSNRYDIIILDPPTFSNSKRTDTTLDINRDWVSLVEKCLGILNEGGILYFSTNSRRLKFDIQKLPVNNDGNPKYTVQDITTKTIPEDYRNNKIHRTWKIQSI